MKRLLSQFSVLSSQFSVSAGRLALALALVTFLPFTARAQVGLQANSARDCAVCHLNWVDSFQRPRQAVLLMDPPGAGVVSESDACLGCHDGGVGDDRHRVWGAHSHVTGIKPPPDMNVPRELPLKNGELACRTCHTAHSGQGPETLATTVFLRMRNDTSQLCVACHSSDTYTGGTEHGSHPLGKMSLHLPADLASAGAHAGSDRQTLTCQSCHEPHGSREDHLLVLPARTSQLCLTCHEKLETTLWQAGQEHVHPVNVPLSTPAQHQAIQAMNTRVGDDDRLICLSCHKMHGAHGGSSILAQTVTNSQICIDCHPEQKPTLGTRHDLRVSAPDEQDQFGRTAGQSGPCGACHGVHKAARPLVTSPLDPTGQCFTCHREGESAAKATGLPFSHPTNLSESRLAGQQKLPLYAAAGTPDQKTFACLTCHDPHQTGHAHFLRSEPTQICATCHSDTLAGFGPQHDFTDRPELLNGRGQNARQAGQCGFCHGVHNASGPAMWVATPTAPSNPNGLCTECHSPKGMARDVEMTPLRHPSGPTATLKLPGVDQATTRPAINAGQAPLALEQDTPGGSSLPLYDSHGRRSADGFVACGSCHDPHGGKGVSDHMLRQTAYAGEATLCAACHGEALAIKGSMHSERLLSQHFEDTRNCAPCHAVHEKPGMPPTGMWAAPLGPETDPAAFRQCTGCHSPGGSAPAVTPTIHPAVPMANLVGPDMPGWMPLYDEKGRVSTTGTIGCGTCHLPHGPLSGQGLPVNVATASIEELRKLRPMVRPYVTPNVCSSCHGFDGLRRYLYYHHPTRRQPLPQEEGRR
jgi:predicted CXXCH cytochrome family protein